MSWTPFGSVRSSSTRPTGSGSSAISRTAAARAATRGSSSRSRSCRASERPVARPRSRSSPFAATISVRLLDRVGDRAQRIALLGVVSRPIARAASFASSIRSRAVVAVVVIRPVYRRRCGPDPSRPDAGRLGVRGGTTCRSRRPRERRPTRSALVTSTPIPDAAASACRGHLGRRTAGADAVDDDRAELEAVQVVAVRDVVDRARARLVRRPRVEATRCR